jgi:capsular exopolysaccharide synthesis family protein
MELRDYLKVMRTRAWLIVLSVVLVTAAAVGYSAVQTRSYQGVATILVTEQDTGFTMLGTPQPQQSYQPGRDLVQTQVEVIQSSRIAQRVVSTLSLNESVRGLMERVTASADTGTNNISIRAIDGSPAAAARIANAYAEQYVAWSRESQSASIKTAADDVQVRLADAQQQIVSIERTATSSSSDQAKLQAARTLYGTLADKLEQLRIAEHLATGAGSVLASATVDSTAVSPKPVRDGALGLAIGLLIGLLAVFLAEQLDMRIKSAEEVAGLYCAPILANIPAEKISKAELMRLTLADRPGSPAAEAYRMLRNNLDFVNFDKGIKTILVTSAVPSEGKSTVAANLATVLSRGGSRVVLVVCDFYLPAAERFFDLDQSVGLSNVLAGSATLSDALQQPQGFANLSVIAPGPLPPNPSELLGSEAMRALVGTLRESADWVILDSAPVLATADAAAVNRWVDGVLVVARLTVTRRDAAHAGYEQLRNVGARILGLAVWGPMDTVSTHGYYGYAHPSRDSS